VPSAAQKFKSVAEEPKQKDNAPPKKRDDEGYKAAIERLPDQKFDPWRNMR
jgi:ribosomal protein S30